MRRSCSSRVDLGLDLEFEGLLGDGAAREGKRRICDMKSRNAVLYLD